MASLESDDEERGGPSVPHGVLRARGRGWAGEELELQHHQENEGKSAAAAVDITQFHNVRVGEGYQAKHVIRQKTGIMSTDMEPVRDMTGRRTTTAAASEPICFDEDKTKDNKSKASDKKKRRSDEPEAEKEKKKKRKEATASTSSELERYLACQGLRRFRRELEDILK